MASNKIQNPTSNIQNQDGAFEKMDRMYRYQRYFYDFTRKYYLLGRDRLLKEMKISEGENVLEIGCGTGRNLIILAKKYPRTRFFGLDASAAMLETARRKIRAENIENITIKKALADDFSFDETFDLKRNFDVIFFSYSISMIPSWKEAIENALRNLETGKSLYIVDFYDQRNLPLWFRKILTGWLRRFDVKFPKDLIPYLEILERRKTGVMKLEPLFKSYSFIIRFEKY